LVGYDVVIPYFDCVLLADTGCAPHQLYLIFERLRVHAENAANRYVSITLDVQPRLCLAAAASRLHPARSRP
jgi:hypothetical protein